MTQNGVEKELINFMARATTNGVSKRARGNAIQSSGSERGLEMASETSDNSSGANESSGQSRGQARESYVEGNKSLFLRAFEYIRPSPGFRMIAYIYGDRKFLIVLIVNLFVTLIIGFHFALIEYEESKYDVKESDPQYWLKLVLPPILVGSIHATLFQMTLLPLTMSRFSIAALSETIVDRILPLNRAHDIHNFIGYTVAGLATFTVATFLWLDFSVCWNTTDEFCKFTNSGVTYTLYVIVGVVLLIATTSYLRRCMPYELFYTIHASAFILTMVLIAQLFGMIQRDNTASLSGSFIWFSTTLLVYFCDWFAIRLNQRYRVQVVSASAMTSGDGSRMLLLKMRRPILFQFKPGQYVFLRMPIIDHNWHPFSIASNPSSPYLEFYIRVLGPNSWTRQLWNVLEIEAGEALGDRSLEFDVMGPIGTGLGKMEDFSHGLLLGAGTGIIPILSVFKQHVRNTLRTSPGEYSRMVEENARQRLEYELAIDSRKGSFIGLWATSWRSKSDLSVGSSTINYSIYDPTAKITHKTRMSTKELKRAALLAKLSVHGMVLMVLCSAFGVALLGITISWNTIPIDLYPQMISALKITTVVFQVCFAVPALLVWDGNNFFSFVDFVVCLVALPANMRWFQSYESNGALKPVEVLGACVLIGYMTARLWWKTVCPRNASWRNSMHDGYGPSMERLEVVWVARSALISSIFSDINDLWEQVVDKWGLENAFKVCRFSIYCTDTDEKTARQLKSELVDTSLYQRGMVSFGHPEFSELIENHSLELAGEEFRNSNTLLAFCGPVELARKIQKLNVSNDMLAAITRNQGHQVEYKSETYGVARLRKEQGLNANAEKVSDAENVTIPSSKFVTNFASYLNEPNNPETLEQILSQSRAQSL